MSYDILVVGGGPAGLTAAIQARVRDKTVLVVTNEPTASPLCKAREMDNYPGMPHVSGLALVETMVGQARAPRYLEPMHPAIGWPTREPIECRSRGVQPVPLRSRPP